MEAFVLDTSRLVSDVIAYVAELKSTFHSTGNPINDDDTTLQKLCVKFETILRHEQKEKYSLLGYRKDYWNFILECIPKDDGVKYVQAVPQMKTAQGKGRCFIRYALVQKTLADAVQRLLVNKNSLSSWYRPDAIFRNPSLSTALVNKLYDLNDVEFDLPCAGYDLDISWPAFSRRKIRDGSTSGRRNSVSSMTSVDFRNDRQDPLVGLATEIASLAEFFNAEFSELNPVKSDPFDNVSMSASNVETPPVSELTLKISHIHQQALKWKSTVNSEKAVVAHELKKAQDDKQFAIKESELKTKQMMEKFSNLSKVSTEQSDKKCSELADKLSEAEKALQERESELKQLRNEVNKSLVDSSTAQKSAIELEKQLTISERKRSELETEMESLRQKLQSKEQIEIEFDFKEKQLKEKMTILESKENEYKESISEIQGSLRAKEVALQSIQESFEKLNGMVFGSFEELEADMKQRLVEKEKGLQNQTVENRKLELNVEELQQQIREKRTKLSEAKAQLEDLQMAFKEIQSSNEKMEKLLKERDEQLQEGEVFVKELGAILMDDEEKTDVDMVDGMTTTNKQDYLIERCRSLFDQVQTLQVEMVNISKMLKEAEERLEKKDQEVQERSIQLESLQTAKNKMSEEFDVLKANKDDLDMEKAVIEEELKTLSTMDDMHAELLQAKQSNTEQENELNDLRNSNTKHTELTQQYEQQISGLTDQYEDMKNTNETLQLDLSKVQDKVTLFESENVGLKEELNVLKEDLKTQTEEKLSLEDELNVAKQQLESANEGRIRAEHAQVKAQEELQNLQCMMDQEVAALKFQLSSETIKYETEIKVLSEQSQESARYKDRSVEQEETIADLETKLKEKSDEWQNEKRKYVNEIKHLRHEVQLLKNALDGNKQKITTLENDLLLTTKQLDEERARQKDMKRKIAEVNEQKIKSEDVLKEQMKDMENDMRELKTKIVTLTREKADYWKRADDLEHELKLKASDRWVEDSEVKHCTNCKTEFSFLVRKHHCRLCGRIFCHSCVNNWVKTAHSSKVKRVCNYCLANDKQLKPQKGPKRLTDEEDFDETMSDISIGASPRKGTRSSTLQSVSDEDIPTRTNKDKNKGERHDSPEKPRAASSPVEDSKTTESNKESTSVENNTAQKSNSHSSEYSSFANTSTASGPTSPREGVTSPVGEGFEVIDPHEEINEVVESRVVISTTDHKEDLVIPAVNDEQGVTREFTVAAGTRYVMPIMVATPGAILCWSFRTVYKSIIFGLAYKDSEKQVDENIETLFPLARYSSNVTPVEGEWKTACHGVYLLVFDNTYSRFTSKQLTCHVHVKRKPSLLHPSS